MGLSESGVGAAEVSEYDETNVSKVLKRKVYSILPLIFYLWLEAMSEILLDLPKEGQKALKVFWEKENPG